jgi:hypothetical protein
VVTVSAVYSNRVSECDNEMKLVHSNIALLIPESSYR